MSYKVVVKTLNDIEIANNTFKTKEEFEAFHQLWIDNEKTPLNALPNIDVIIITSYKEESHYVKFDTKIVYK